MKVLTLKNVTLALLLVLASIPLAAQVYKTVDENGNVVYTDQPPKDGSAPIELRPISIIEAPVYEKATVADGQEGGPESAEKSLRSLQRHYEGFAIVSPQSEATIWYSDNAIPVTWSTPNALEAGLQVTVSVDGRSQPPTRQSVVEFAGLERGEHTITAELRDTRNRRIVTARPVTFFLRQPSTITNTARQVPGGGN